MRERDGDEDGISRERWIAKASIARSEMARDDAEIKLFRIKETLYTRAGFSKETGVRHPPIGIGIPNLLQKNLTWQKCISEDFHHTERTKNLISTENLYFFCGNVLHKHANVLHKHALNGSKDAFTLFME